MKAIVYDDANQLRDHRFKDLDTILRYNRHRNIEGIVGFGWLSKVERCDKSPLRGADIVNDDGS
jgi:hypothetical protein